MRCNAVSALENGAGCEAPPLRLQVSRRPPRGRCPTCWADWGTSTAAPASACRTLPALESGRPYPVSWPLPLHRPPPGPLITRGLSLMQSCEELDPFFRRWVGCPITTGTTRPESMPELLDGLWGASSPRATPAARQGARRDGGGVKARAPPRRSAHCAVHGRAVPQLLPPRLPVGRGIPPGASLHALPPLSSCVSHPAAARTSNARPPVCPPACRTQR